MTITRRAVPRRTVLQAIGTTLALPFLDAMVPAFATAAQTKPPMRFGVMYHPNGIIIRDFVPPTAGKDFEITPILTPLAQYREHLTIVSGTANAPADPFE